MSSPLPHRGKRVLPCLAIIASSSSRLAYEAAPVPLQPWAVEVALAADDTCVVGSTSACALNALQALGRRTSVVRGAAVYTGEHTPTSIPLAHEAAPPSGTAAPAASPSLLLQPGGAAPRPAAAAAAAGTAPGQSAHPNWGLVVTRGLGQLPALLGVGAARVLGSRHQTQAILLSMCSVAVLALLGMCLAVCSMRPKVERRRADVSRAGASGFAGRGFEEAFEAPEGGGRPLSLPSLQPLARRHELERGRDKRDKRAQRKRGQDICC